MYQHLADLLVFALFFAMRSCEFSEAEEEGKTKRVSMGDLVFRRGNRSLVQKDNLGAADEIEFVTVCFKFQKNTEKMERRTQRRTADKVMCPCKQGWSLVQRIRRTVKDWDKGTNICAYWGVKALHRINQRLVRETICQVCRNHGGFEVFGVNPDELGNKSIRSGAAMALVLSDKNYSNSKIMILGRWKSTAFMKYIRPQVLEWANNMLQDMTSTEDFLDLGSRS